MQRRGRVRRILLAILVLALLVIVFVPVGGRVPQRCVYDGDVGACETLGYRGLATIIIANLRWGGENTSSGAPGG